MRQVNEAELVWGMKYQIRRLSQSVRNGLAGKDDLRRKQMEQLLAEMLVKEVLGRYEILSDAPLDPAVGDLFSAAAYGTHVRR